MAEQSYKGSIILKIFIVLLVVVLAAVIYFPNKNWKEEDSLEEVSRNNMISLYEAQNYYYGRNNTYVKMDSLEEILTFIKNDSSLQKKQNIGHLTKTLHKSLTNILEIPLLKSILPISQSINEINDELNFNSRYFTKYDHIVSQSDNVLITLPKFNNSADFPNFCTVKSYVDSLSLLKERINDYKLQNAALEAHRFLDSLIVYANSIELSAVDAFWKEQNVNINNLLNDIKKTDIVLVSTVVDRTKKFTDRIKSTMQDLSKINTSQSIEALHTQKEYLYQVHQNFISDVNFLQTQNYGQLQLNETDSILVKLNEKNFYDPDTFDGKQRYLVHFIEGDPRIIIESPNLLDIFHAELLKATEPLNNLSVYPLTGKLNNSLDSTINLMNTTKDEYRLSRYSTEVLLNLKEIIAEMQQELDNVRTYRYVTQLKSFVDTVQTEKRLSALKPMIEDILNPMDTLAAHLEKADLSDIVNKLNYFGGKVQKLDSLIQASSQIPANVRRRVPAFYPSFEEAYTGVEEIRTGFNPDDAQKIREASDTIEEALLNVLEGYREPVKVVFYKTHKNHGFIENGSKSWEE